MLIGIIAMAGMLALQEAGAGTTPIHDAYFKNYATPTNINGIITCGTVAYWSSNNAVQFVRLATNQVLWGHELPAGTGISFKPDGTPFWCFLAKNTELEGHVLIGAGHNWMTGFYPGGQLRCGGLVNVELIDGIPCAQAYPGMTLFRSNPTTWFHENGHLKSAEAAITFRHRDGQIIEKGKRITLKPDGSIESIK